MIGAIGALLVCGAMPLFDRVVSDEYFNNRVLKLYIFRSESMIPSAPVPSTGSEGFGVSG